MTTSTLLTTPATTDYVAYDYQTVRAPRELAALYQDTYRNFGWNVTTGPISGSRSGIVELEMKRDRRIRNRTAITELEGQARRSLLNIDRLNSTPRTAGIWTAVAVGLVGTALLAGSVFTLVAGAILVSVGLGVVGLLGWSAGIGSYFGVRSRSAKKVAAAIDAEYQTLHEAGAQANRLLA